MNSANKGSFLRGIVFWITAGLVFLFWENLASAVMNNYAFEVRRTLWGMVYYPLLFLLFGSLIELASFILGKILPFQRWSGQKQVWLLCILAVIVWGDMSRQMLIGWFNVSIGFKSWALNLFFLSAIPAIGFIVNIILAKKERAGILPDKKRLLVIMLTLFFYILISNKVTYRYFQYDMLVMKNVLLQPVFMIVSFLLAWIMATIFQPGKLRKALLIVPLALTLLVVGVPAVFSSAFGPDGHTAVQRIDQPNFIVLLFDAMRGDHTGSGEDEGNSLTPFIDELAKRGRSYSSAYSTCSWTYPAVISLLSSKLPNKVGLLQRVYVPDDLALLPEILRQNGYRTGCLSANGLISESFGFDRSFDEFKFLRGSGPKQIFLPFRSFFPAPHFFDEIAYQFGFISTDLFSGDWEDMNAQASDFIERQRSEPFFLYVHYIEPHSPYWAKPYSGQLIDFQQIKRVYYQPMIQAQVIRGKMNPDDPVFQELGMGLIDTYHKRYKEGVQVTDEAVREIVQSLDRQGLTDNTVVIVLADHGEGFFEHGKTGHGHTLHNEQTAIPLVVIPPLSAEIELPEQPGGVSLVDVAPTILDFAGIPGGMPDGDGRSLLQAYPDSNRASFMFLETETRKFYWTAIISEPYKLMTRVDLKTSEIDTFLHNLDVDPGEKINLYPSQYALAESLATILKVQTDQTVEPVAERMEDLSPQELERLRALGYVN